VPEHSLHTPPIYRRFLAGGAAALRLSLPASAVVIFLGLILPATAGNVAMLGGGDRPAIWWPSVAAAALNAWLIAALAARWLGSRLGLLAGLALLTCVHVLLLSRGSAAEMLYGTAVVVAMGAFALANVPGRLPVIDRWWIRVGFYAAAGVSFVSAGAIGPAFILAGCLLFLILSADTRGVRFFASPGGIAVFVLMAAIRLAQPEALHDVWAATSGMVGESLGPRVWLPAALGWLALAVLPWTPLVALAAVAGLREGHYATPIWRFFACWALGPLGLAAVGGFRDQWQLGPLLPPLAVMAAAGLRGLLLWCRRKWPQLRGRRTGDR
jgi:4-amino-4-deoxy-L-arabinose transferase-like glycosyltransferase